MLDNLILCNLPHPIAFNEARNKSLEQILKSWYAPFLCILLNILMFNFFIFRYIVYFQVPVLPELGLMGDDIKSFDALFKENKNNDEEVKEAYRYAFRDYKTWNRTINYYRATTSSKTQELLRPSDKWRIKVR